MLENYGTVIFSNDKTYLLAVLNVGQLVCIEIAGNACAHTKKTHTYIEHGVLMSLFFLCEKECMLQTGTQNTD